MTEERIRHKPKSCGCGLRKESVYPDECMNGYKIIEQNETPGLGSKITENKFKNQFYGLNAHNDNNLELIL